MRLRIVAGALKGRVLRAPEGFKTHPMGERVRAALFNKLGSVEGLSLLDAYAGSGAIACEAISRGAERAVAIERDRRAQQAIKENIAALGLEANVKLIRAGVRAWSITSQGETFDIIACDPPYGELKTSTISQLAEHMKTNGLMVVSYSGREPTPTVNGVVVVDKSDYGDAALAIYQKGAA